MTQPATWIVGPVGQAVSFVADEARLGGLLVIALTYVENAKPLVQAGLAAAIASGDPARIAAAKRIADDHPLLDQWARDLRSNDYPTLNSHSVVAIWAAIETCIEDTITLILINDQAPRPRIAALLPNVVIPPQLSDEQARVIYHKLEKRLRVPDDTAATYETLLQFFGLTAAVPSAISQSLNELNAVRNCILHRGGAVDARARKHISPTLVDPSGVVALTSARYQDYHRAVSEWLIALMTSAVSSAYYVAAS